MRNFKKPLASFLALIMAVGLLACGKDNTPPPPTDGQEITETPVESVGTVVLAGTGRTTLHYNGKGDVITITDQNGLACFSSLLDKPCAEAAAQIVKESESANAAPFLLIKQNAGSLEPAEDFLSGIVAEVEKVANDLPIIVSSIEDQNAMCYFSAETATAVLAAYLGNPEGITYTVNSSADNGYYQISASSATAFAQFSVGALYGPVEQELEPVDDTPGEEFSFDDLGMEPDLTEDDGEIYVPQG